MSFRRFKEKVGRGLIGVFSKDDRRGRSTSSIFSKRSSPASSTTGSPYHDEQVQTRPRPSSEPCCNHPSASEILSNLQLKTVFDDKDVRESFNEFCKLQHCCENLHFFEAAQQFRDQQSEASPSVRMLVARKIYERYVRDEAPEWVCLSPLVAKEICDRLDANALSHPGVDTDEFNAAASPSVFDTAQREVWSTLESDVLPRFAHMLLKTSLTSPDKRVLLLKLLNVCEVYAGKKQVDKTPSITSNKSCKPASVPEPSTATNDLDEGAKNLGNVETSPPRKRHTVTLRKRAAQSEYHHHNKTIRLTSMSRAASSTGGCKSPSASFPCYQRARSPCRVPGNSKASYLRKKRSSLVVPT